MQALARRQQSGEVFHRNHPHPNTNFRLDPYQGSQIQDQNLDKNQFQIRPLH